jgi:hypothetical protein
MAAGGVIRPDAGVPYVAITVILNLAAKTVTAFTTADGFTDEDLRDVD